VNMWYPVCEARVPSSTDICVGHP